MTDNGISRESVVVVTERQVSSNLLDDEIVTLDVQEGAYYLLNPVSARIWSMIQTPKVVDEIIDTLLEEYEVTPERCSSEVLDLLRDLAARKLIEVRDAAD